jgi:glycosyltransferase involved in cell wall biosynthesis
MSMANVTTVIPVYNGGKHIAETLESLARQTIKPDRVIVVDDCSTDNTEAIVKAFKPIRCEWMPNDHNLGLFPNHNSALRFASQTRFFHILHANDLIAPSFFEKLLPLIENAPGFAMAFCGHVFIKENGQETTQVGAISYSGPRLLSLREFLAMQTELKSSQLHSALLKTGYEEIPVQFRTDLPQLGDVIFHAQFAAECSEIWGHPEVLCQVRIHSDSATNKNIKNMNAWVLDEWKAMRMVYDLMRQKGLGGWSRNQKLKLLFAARSQVKMQKVRLSDPRYAREIERAVKPLTGAYPWRLARLIVAVRDMLFPKSDMTQERLTQNK